MTKKNSAKPRLTEAQQEHDAERNSELAGQVAAEAAGVYDADAGDVNDLPGMACDVGPHANTVEPTEIESALVDTLVGILRCNTAAKCHVLAKDALCKWSA